MKAVYYPSMVPNNRYTITQLAILFDSIILPGAYLPLNKLDKKEITERIQQIESVDMERGAKSYDMLMPLYFAKEYQELGDIFIGTGEWGHMGVLEPEAHDLTMELESLYFGPPEPGFTPVPTMGFNFGVGSENDVTKQINGPAFFSYPANAYVYANKHDLPLISDTTMMPMPRGTQPSTKINADKLTAQLSLASLSLILPRVKPLSAPQILEVRSKLDSDIKALNATLAGYASKLREKVGDNPESELLQQEAEFIAKTEIYPQLEHLRRTLETPGQILNRNAIDFALENPELFARIALQPHDLEAWLSVLKASSGKIKQTIDEVRNGALAERSSGLSLLLKLPKKYRS